MSNNANFIDEPLPADQDRISLFIGRWQRSGASERANYALFLVELCDVLGLPHPEPATGQAEADLYVFERPVQFHNADGRRAPALSTYTATAASYWRQNKGVRLSGRRGCWSKLVCVLPGVGADTASAGRRPGTPQCCAPAARPSSMPRHCPSGRPFWSSWMSATASR